MSQNPIRNNKKIDRNTILVSLAAAIFLIVIIGAWVLIMSYFSAQQDFANIGNKQDFTDYIESNGWRKTGTREYLKQAVIQEYYDITSFYDITVTFKQGEALRNLSESEPSDEIDAILSFKSKYRVDDKRMIATIYLDTLTRADISFSEGESSQSIEMELDYYYAIGDNGELIERLALYDNLIDEYYFISDANIYERIR